MSWGEVTSAIILLFALAQLTVEDLALLIPPPPLLGEGGATTQGSESNPPPWSILPEGVPLSLTSTSGCGDFLLTHQSHTLFCGLVNLKAVLRPSHPWVLGSAQAFE